MTQLLGSELLKLRTTRVAIWLLVASVGLGVLMATLIALLSTKEEVSGEVGGRLVLSSGGIAAGVIALLFGIIATAGEYRHGTISPTLLVTPGRLRVTFAQVVACALAGALIGIASVAAAMAIGALVLAVRDVALVLSVAQLVGIAAGGALFAALSGALGAAFGVLLRNQVLAVVLALLALFVIEPLITEFVSGYQRYSLVGIRTTITGGAAEAAGAAEEGLPSFWLAVLLWTAYTIAFIIAASAVGRRRDVMA